MGHNGSFRSLCVLMDFNVSLCDLISPYASLRVVMGPARSVCDLDGPYGSL